MKSIPVSSAEQIAKKFGFDQVIIVARKTGDNGGEHVTTFGVDPKHCRVAAGIGDFLKTVIMKWTNLPKWFGRIVYSGEGIVRQKEFQTQAEAEAYKLGADDMRSQSDESLCDCDPLDDHFSVASNEPSIDEDNAVKCRHPKCKNIVDKTVQAWCDDHGGVICG